MTKRTTRSSVRGVILPAYLRQTLAAILPTALVTFAGQAESVMLTFDLNNGTIDNMVKYDSGPIMIALPQVPIVVVPQAPSLEISIVFKDHQLLKLTDGGSDVFPNQEEQIFTVKFVGPGDPTMEPTQIVELDATIKLELTGQRFSDHSRHAARPAYTSDVGGVAEQGARVS